MLRQTEVILSKVKVKLFLCLTKHYTMIRGSECTDPRCLTSALVGGEWLASRSCCFTPMRKIPGYSFDMRLGGGGGQSMSVRCGEVKIIDTPRTRTTTARAWSQYPLAIPTDLSRLPNIM
jgi:hypothetical protein